MTAPELAPTTDPLQRLRKLTELSRVLTSAASIDEIFQLTVAHAAELMAVPQVLLMVAGEDGLLLVRAAHGVAPAVTRSLCEPLSEVLVSRLAVTLGAAADSFLAVPLVATGAVVGVLIAIRPSAAPVAEHDEWLLSALADQAAVALARARLDEVAEFREQLIGIVGHDLRTPLGTVAMAAQLLLQRDGLGEAATELARKIARSATLATRLIGQLLDLTRSRLGGGIPTDLQPMDLRTVLRQVTDEADLSHADRPVHVQIRGDLAGEWDRDRIYQLLSNLVGNAINHGEPRTAIELRVDGTEAVIVLEIANRGVPIPDALLATLFDAYRKKRDDHGSRAQGLGLGLFICRQIVRAHGGAIAVTSSASEGTTFRVHLPRRSSSTVSV